MATQHKAIFLTGAAGGIGSQLVPLLLERGWIVYAGTTSNKPLPVHSRLHQIPLDVTDEASVADAARAISDVQGANGLQAVLNLAGVIVQGPLELIPKAEMMREFEVNTLGPMSVMQHFLPLLRAGKGRIVNVTAISDLMPLPFFGAVAASKVALLYLSEALHMELKRWHIPVITVAPGAMRTEVFSKAQDNFEQSLNEVSADDKRLYGSMIAGASAVLAKQRESDPMVAAKVILKALESDRPKRRYLAGTDAQLVGRTVPHLPRRLRETLVATAAGINK